MSPTGRTLRLITGLYLFLFAACHLLTLAFGLSSLGSMERAHGIIMALWMTQVGSVSLLAALVIHLGFGFYALYRRNTLNMRAGDSIQFLSAFLIVPLLLPHAIAMSSFDDLFDAEPSFPVMLDYFWNAVPLDGFKQVLVVILVWVHGCIGLLSWMRLWDGWPRLAPLINPLIVAIPVLALLGFVEAGNQVVEMSGGTTRNLFEIPAHRPALLQLGQVVSWTMQGYYALLLAVVLARALRIHLIARGDRVTVSFSSGETLEIKPGLNLLEVANTNGVPHPAQCRGRGRCGTCRVRINSDVPLPEPSAIELRTLERVSPDHEVNQERLACQLNLSGGNYTVQPILQADLSEPGSDVEIQEASA